MPQPRQQTAAVARIVFNLPLAGPFDYRIPPELFGRVRVGARVAAPFGRRRLIGYVTALARTSDIPAPRLRTFTRLIDAQPWCTPDLLRLAGWLSATCGVDLGEALATIMPARLPVWTPAAAPDEAGAAVNAAPPALVQPILDALHAGRHRVVMLEAGPESRTAWCAALVDDVAAAGGGVLWLVPEISAARALADAMGNRWGVGRLAVLHGRTPPRQRAAAYANIRAGVVRVLIGTRSALFAPWPALRLIIVDEEQDASHKHPEMPAYHARTVAIERGRRHRAVVVLASATPSLDTWHAAATRRYAVVRMPPSTPPPRVDIVDVRHQRHRPVIFSVILEEALRRTLEHRGQALLLLNRRGFATWVHCKTCQMVLRCPSCGAALVYHFARKTLICHACSTQQPAPELCPRCHERYLRYQGLGTEKVVSETCRLFPQARVARLDLDAAQESPHRLARVAEDLVQQRLDVLVGTQLVMKLPAHIRVPLVGVISADTALHVPDFRAGEHTFALLSSARARATERLIIQTANPRHPAIQAVQRGDAERFYREELRARRTLGLPPCRQLIRLLITDGGEELVMRHATALGAALDAAGAAVIGPAPVIGAHQRWGQHAWQVLLKGTRLAPMLALVRKVIGPQRRFQGVGVRIDVDPY